jgi:metal-dependent amidase/aminoacylase/carboxypeptidase family protein
MKKIVVILLFLISNFSYGQFDYHFPEEKNKTVKTKEFLKQYMKKQNSDSITVYCEIIGHGNLIGTKVKVEIDFGEDQNYFEKNWIKNKEGEKVTFNSMIDALNYMSHRGWSLHSTMGVTHGNKNVYHFIMYKKIKMVSENH